jgi:hypothetical protein
MDHGGFEKAIIIFRQNQKRGRIEYSVGSI